LSILKGIAVLFPACSLMLEGYCLAVVRQNEHEPGYFLAGLNSFELNLIFLLRISGYNRNKFIKGYQ
jgi:hypothetical protein